MLSFMRQFWVEQHLGDLQAVTPLGVSVFRDVCVSGVVEGDYLMAGDVVVRRFRGRDQRQEGLLGRGDLARCQNCWRWQAKLYKLGTLELEEWGTESYQVCKQCMLRERKKRERGLVLGGGKSSL